MQVLCQSPVGSVGASFMCSVGAIARCLALVLLRPSTSSGCGARGHCRATNKSEATHRPRSRGAELDNSGVHIHVEETLRQAVPARSVARVGLQKDRRAVDSLIEIRRNLPSRTAMREVAIGGGKQTEAMLTRWMLRADPHSYDLPRLAAAWLASPGSSRRFRRGRECLRPRARTDRPGHPWHR